MFLTHALLALLSVYCLPGSLPGVLAQDPVLCVDEASGAAFSAGTTWTSGPCTTCTCDPDYGTICYTVDCANLICEYPSTIITPAGECCPICSEPCMDSETGEEYSVGEEWQPDDCTWCTCAEINGEVQEMCAVSSCAEPQCEDPIYVEGQCCPVCSDCEDAVNCLVDPCSVATCENYPYATCHPNYCGGCSAEFYDDNEDLISDCSGPCGGGKHYTECGSACARTCSNPDPACIYLYICVAKCECPSSAPFLRQGGCLTEEECSSLDDDVQDPDCYTVECYERNSVQVVRAAAALPLALLLLLL